jgi:hypothetical protein
MGEFSKQLGWLVKACTTDVVKQVMGVKKKKKQKSHVHFHVNYHFFQNKKKPRR